MQITDKFPQPKFQIGQRVHVMKNITKDVITEKVFIVVQIMLACMSILFDPFQKEEPFDYMLLNEDDIGKGFREQELMYNCRESFMIGVE
jgi:hypothetical protein